MSEKTTVVTEHRARHSPQNTAPRKLDMKTGIDNITC